MRAGRKIPARKASREQGIEINAILFPHLKAVADARQAVDAVDIPRLAVSRRADPGTANALKPAGLAAAAGDLPAFVISDNHPSVAV